MESSKNFCFLFDLLKICLTLPRKSGEGRVFPGFYIDQFYWKDAGVVERTALEMRQAGHTASRVRIPVFPQRYPLGSIEPGGYFFLCGLGKLNLVF
jgi:hypothetical protein